jgi:hypothetical protein
MVSDFSNQFTYTPPLEMDVDNFNLKDFSTQTTVFTPPSTNQFPSFKNVNNLSTQTPIITIKDDIVKIDSGNLKTPKYMKTNRKDFTYKENKRIKLDDEEVINVDVNKDGTITTAPTEFTTDYWNTVEQEASELTHYTEIFNRNQAQREAAAIPIIDVDDTLTVAGSPTESLQGFLPNPTPPIIVTDVVDARIVAPRVVPRVAGQLRTVAPKKTPMKINTTNVAGPSKTTQFVSPNEISTTPVAIKQTLPLPPKPKRKYVKKVVSVKNSVASRTRSKAPVSSRTRSKK